MDRPTHDLMDTSKREITDREKDFVLQWATNDHFQQTCLLGAAACCLLRAWALQFIPAPTSPLLVRKHFLLANKSMLLA